MPLILDLTETARTTFHSGIQRVCRQTLAELTATGASTVPLVYDSSTANWHRPNPAERALLSTSAAERSRPPQDKPSSLSVFRKLFARDEAKLDWATLRGSPLLVPEISPTSFRAYPELRARLGGVAGAIFYDAVLLRLPQYSDADTNAWFCDYLRSLAQFDGIAAISESSRTDLLEFWGSLGVSDPPPVISISLAADPPPLRSAPPDRTASEPLVLCVSSIEGRKNHLALLEAAEILWNKGSRFRLVLAGRHSPRFAHHVTQRAAELSAAGRSLDVPGAVTDSHLWELYAACRFTVYPSIFEGFGLPVAESLQHHRPCICGPGGALAEVASGGGCIMVSEPTAPHLAEAMSKLLQDDVLLARLTSEAAHRRFPTWAEYGRQILAWMGTLRRRPH